METQNVLNNKSTKRMIVGNVYQKHIIITKKIFCPSILKGYGKSAVALEPETLIKCIKVNLYYKNTVNNG